MYVVTLDNDILLGSSIQSIWSYLVINQSLCVILMYHNTYIVVIVYKHLRGPQFLWVFTPPQCFTINSLLAIGVLIKLLLRNFLV